MEFGGDNYLHKFKNHKSQSQLPIQSRPQPPQPWYYCVHCESPIGQYKPCKTWTCRTTINQQQVCGHTEWCTIIISKPHATRLDFLNVWNMLRK